VEVLKSTKFIQCRLDIKVLKCMLPGTDSIMTCICPPRNQYEPWPGGRPWYTTPSDSEQSSIKILHRGINRWEFLALKSHRLREGYPFHTSDYLVYVSGFEGVRYENMQSYEVMVTTMQAYKYKPLKMNCYLWNTEDEIQAI
jgi:hypothetical protein